MEDPEEILYTTQQFSDLIGEKKNCVGARTSITGNYRGAVPIRLDGKWIRWTQENVEFIIELKKLDAENNFGEIGKKCRRKPLKIPVQLSGESIIECWINGHSKVLFFPWKQLENEWLSDAMQFDEIELIKQSLNSFGRWQGLVDRETLHMHLLRD